MGIFDFFKAKQEEKQEKIEFEDLDRFIAEKRKKEQEKEKIVLKKIDLLISEFISELKIKVETAEKIDISGKREHEKIKDVVTENLSKYLESVKQLINDFRETKESSFEKAITCINNNFLQFDRRSRVAFDRATILIGKELGDIKDSITHFSKQLKQIIQENEALVQNLKTLTLIEIENIKIRELKGQTLAIAEEIENIEQNIQELEKKKRVLEKKTEETKNSKDYIDGEKSKINVINDKRALEKEIGQLRSFIDFKSLEKKYHGDIKKMSIIKSYENEDKIIDGDYGDLSPLIEEGKRGGLIEKVANIREKNKKIKETLDKKDILEEFKQEQVSVDFSIREMILDKEKTKKRLESIEPNIKKIKKDIAEKLLKMGVVIE